MSFYLGIDGGGTRLRAALCDDAMRVLAQREYGTANPNIIGREASAALIQQAVREILADAHIDANRIVGAGIGIAGMSADHATDWLDAVMRGVLPRAFINCSSDIEIALVGAHGEHCGILILSGTGSSAYGVNRAGASALVGGWGYLLGDEGSGFWIGLEAVRIFTREADHPGATHSILPARVAQQLNIATPKALIRRLYGEGVPQVADIAALAPLVLEAAEAGDAASMDILLRAADALARLARTVQRRLDADDLPIAFAGGLLQGDNRLRRALCSQLELARLPQSRFPPVIGAALLAKQRLEAKPDPF